MGTRNLTCVVEDGEFRVAQYGQSDGYPSYSGIKIKNFCEDKDKLNALKVHSNDVVFALNETMNKLIENSLWKEKYPQFHRNTGWEILELLAKEPLIIYSSLEFAADSLFCEWCYVIDFDKNTFEVYEGFNKEELTKEDRFYFLQKTMEEDGYYPVKLYNIYSLDDLPSDEDFLKHNPDTGSDGD